MTLGFFFNGGGFNGDISTKELIVRILCDEWPLSVRQIHERMKRRHGIYCSYQAVFKQVKELLDKGILSSKGRYYKMNEKWLEGVNLFIKNLLEYYEKNPQGIIGASNNFSENFSRKSRKFAEINPYL